MEATATAPVLSRPFEGIRPYFVPAALVLLALIVRLPYLDIIGLHGDYGLNSSWGDAVYRHIFSFFSHVDSNHPPLFPVMNGLSRAVTEIPAVKTFLEPLGFNNVVRLKLFPVLADLILIIVVYQWLKDRQYLRYIIPLLLIAHPGLINVSAQWGQSDPILTLLLALSIIALHRGKPDAAWFWFAIALLTKFQAIVLLPLLIVLTYRRFPLSTAITAALTGALVFAAVMLPFVFANEWRLVSRPYLSGAVDLFPHTTVNAFNFWCFVDPGFWQGAYGFGPDDGRILIAPFTYKQIGFIMLGVYVLLICVVMWKRSREHKEFVWAAALYFGFFTLPTQIHERYLYPGVVFAIIGIAQDKRLAFAALATFFTFTHNLVHALNGIYRWAGSIVWYYLGNAAPRVSLMQCLLFVEVMLIAVFARVPRLVGMTRLALAAVVVNLTFVAANPPRETLPAQAQPVHGVTMLDSIQLLGYLMEGNDKGYTLSLFWQTSEPINAYYVPLVEAEREGRVVSYSRGSYADDVLGTWRWSRGSVERTVHHLDIDDKPLPDSLYVGMIDAYSDAIAPVMLDGVPLRENRALIALFDLGEGQ